MFFRNDRFLYFITDMVQILLQVFFRSVDMETFRKFLVEKKFCCGVIDKLLSPSENLLEASRT